MRRFSALFFAGAVLILLCGCGGGGNSVGPLSIAFTSTPVTVPGGTNFVFSVTTQNDTLNRGVNFTLALNEPSNGDTTTPCTTACGTLSGQSNTVTANGPDTFTSTTTVNFAAPLLPPTPNSLILTATADANSSVTLTDTFTIGAPQVVVHITNKITNIAPDAEPVTLNAQVLFDTANAGVTWALMAQGAACSPACGALSSAQPFSVIYTPPATLPAAPNNTPTITATSVTTTTVSDFDDIRIQASAQPISVSISNPFAQINAGSAGVTINAVVNNDVAGQGVSWSLEPTAQAGALSAQQPLSVIYTPPNTAPQSPNNTPMITATSVADPTKSDSFTFTIAPPAAFQGNYTFIVRGHDDGGNAIAAVGSLRSDGAGKITAGEIDLKSSDGSALESGASVAGNYESRKAQDGTDDVDLRIENALSANPPIRITFTASFGNSREVTGSGPGTSPVSSERFPAVAGKISGQSGKWILEGEITRHEMDPVVIADLAGKALAFQLRAANESAIYELGRFSLSDSGAIIDGSLSSVQGGPVGLEGNVLEGGLVPFDEMGRSTLTVALAKSAGTHRFAAYAISERCLLLIETDSGSSFRSPVIGEVKMASPSH
jgi:hypothetical protein